MLIRAATLVDLNGCLELDADSQTDHVWQMEERQDQGLVVRFQVVRLPRVMRVVYPRLRDDLIDRWEGGSLVLVASDQRPAELEVDQVELGEPHVLPRVFAYCQLDDWPWQRTGWIEHLIVDRRLRRKGIGRAMIRACVAWARQKKLERLMIAVQTKNYPAISFCEKNGFVFCGFNDCYFPNRDIALFFALRV
jgi:GNAT superfamily N-acetyltransferase